MKTLIWIVVAVVVVIGGWVWLGNGNTENTPTPTISVTVSPSVSVTASPSGSPSTSPTATRTVTPTSVSTVKSFTIVGKPYSFTPNLITVNKGDTVKITFHNDTGNHNWKIDEFNAHTDVISAGKEQTIQFVADKTGTFEYYCGVSNHRQLGMKGTLIVK